jgi:hypothetical protein
MTVDISVSPYYDDYDPSKKYNQLLAVPGRVEQARDFTQMQTMVYDYLQRLSDTLFKNGSVIGGMGWAMKTSTIVVQDGRVYVNGKIHMFSQQEIPVTKVGLETIGIKAVDSIVTESDDTSLLDPTTSTGNLGQPGTHRIKTDIILVLNDATASTIYTFQDGNLVSESPKPQFDGLAAMLAQRTYDESGNYRVRGLTLDVEPHDANYVNLIIEAGTAYVMGYQIVKPTPIRALVSISKSARNVVGEPKTYITGTSKYLLNNVPAMDITQVTAYVQILNESKTRGASPGGTDFLSKTPVVDVQTVSAGGTTYVRGTDWQLTSNGIDWSLGGAEPTSGSTYTVTYTYNKTMVQGVDYQMYSEIGDFGETKDYVQFLSADKPMNNTTFWVDYDFYLARMDSVAMDKDGGLYITGGQPDIPRNVSAPIISDPTLLPLGTIYLPPNSGGAVAKFSTVTRLDMSQLQRMSQRVDDLEFNQAISSLDRDTMDGELPTDLRGIFSDSFRSTERADLTNPLFNVMYDLEFGQIMLPLASTTSRTPVVSTTNTIKQWRRLATTPSTEVVAASQPYATTTMLVNPYLAFNSMGMLQLTPQVYNWIEDSTINIQSTQFKARNFWRWWSHTNQPWTYDKNADLMNAKIVSGAPAGTTLYDWRPPYTPGTYPTATVVTTNKSTKIIMDAITYMKQISVQIYAKNLQPATDNLSLTLDGVTCPLTPVSGYSAGSATGTVRANSSGEVKATFTVPANIKTGTREVILSNSGNTASTSFTSIGTKETTVNTVITTYTTLTAIDPLAQTFQFDKDTMLTSVGVYFAAKDATNNVKVQIRNVVNGYPGNVIYGEQLLTPSQINVSNDSHLETKISFDDPIVCVANTQYAMVFLSDSAVHSMYICNLGQKDILSGGIVAREPYLPGLLFSSSNGIAWTAHQSMNMKFNIYKAQFNLNSTIDFSTQTSMNADRLLLLADVVVPTGCAVTWQVSLDSGSYQPITPYLDLDALKVASTVKLRLLMTATGDLSPMVAMDSLILTGWTTATSGSYIGRNVELTQSYTDVKQIYDAHIPSGCAVTAQFSYDGGTTWLTPTQTSATPMSADFTRYICEASVSSSVNAMNFRARLNITSNDPTLRPTAQRFANIMK